MTQKKYIFLPEVSYGDTEHIQEPREKKVIGDSPCPCCSQMTIPNDGDALAYICPVCYWEIDLFIQGEDEASDLNRGLTLREAKDKYQKYGKIFKDLK